MFTGDFVAALRGLARTCQFGPMESELIRDVVVEKTPHQRLRERLLQDRDLTLDKVLSIAETYEDSLREAAAISQPVAAPPVSSVAKVTRKPQQKRQQQRQQSTSSDFCTNCGRDDHAPRDAVCPARRVTCHSCRKKGHFASWCRGGSGAAPARPAQRQHHKAVKELNVLSCAATTGSRLTCTVQVTAGDVTQEVPLQVDTGATCSLLSVNRAKELFRGVAFSPSSSRLYGFDQQPLPVLGTLPTTVTYNNQAVPTNFYLVDTKKTEAIMGMDLLQALGVNLHPASHSVYTSRLLPYSYTVEYRPGRSIPVADALSRLPLPDTGAAETDGDEIVALLTDDVSDVITDDDVCAASTADPVMEQLRSVIRTGWPAAARQCTPETRDYFAVRHELQVRQDGVVLRGPDRAVVPAALRSKYLQLEHRAHDGVVRTKQLLRDLAWWPGMSKDAAALVADCPSCHAKDAVLTQQARPAPLQPVELPDRPWSKLGLDIRLALYRATPHCTTGQSPSALLHGRRMRLHLPVTTETPPRDSSLQHRVATQQQRNSRGYDSRQASRPSDLQPGDTVRVRRQGHVPKNQSRFSSPRRIARQLGPATFILSDGTKRNAAHLARIPDAAPTGSAPPSTDRPEPPPPPPPADPAPPSSGESQPPPPQPTASTAPPTASTESARPSDVADVALPAATGAARDRSPGGPRPPQRAPVGGTPRR
ncbi:uncharacterized protein FJT64_023854 [Amphibalanus amphitrite]|uniref:RNA-directed DNA polymerase n=1 Tax=Amphibalanus amphitrite TaxID=1232801 RepID=A0A6A4WQI8_AMPAM|nr:uncharacterized protein FJT64_023854 [Amphibalanus amphitrite]